MDLSRTLVAEEGYLACPTHEESTTNWSEATFQRPCLVGFNHSEGYWYSVPWKNVPGSVLRNIVLWLEIVFSKRSCEGRRKKLLLLIQFIYSKNTIQGTVLWPVVKRPCTFEQPRWKRRRSSKIDQLATDAWIQLTKSLDPTTSVSKVSAWSWSFGFCPSGHGEQFFDSQLAGPKQTKNSSADKGWVW